MLYGPMDPNERFRARRETMRRRKRRRRAALVGLVNGIGVGIFRVQPLIMTLATGLVVLGGANVYQKLVITAGSRVPEPVATLGSGTSFGFFPNTLFVFIPIALLIMLMLKRTGYGRMLYAVRSEEHTSEL